MPFAPSSCCWIQTGGLLSKQRTVRRRLLAGCPLLAYGADPAVLARNSSSALSAAVYRIDVAMVRQLLCNGGAGVRRVALQHGLGELLQMARAGLEVKRGCSCTCAPDGFSDTDLRRVVRLERCHRVLCETLQDWFQQQATTPEVRKHAACAPALHCAR